MNIPGKYSLYSINHKTIFTPLFCNCYFYLFVFLAGILKQKLDPLPIIVLLTFESIRVQSLK